MGRIDVLQARDRQIAMSVFDSRQRFLDFTIRFEWCLAALTEQEEKRNPNWHLQPRVPPGSTEGGRWTGWAILIGTREVFVTSAVAAVAKAILKVRRMYANLMRIMPLPIVSSPPPLLGIDDHVQWGGTLRRPNVPYLEFESYIAFRFVLGAAPRGYEWHHIVERRMADTLGIFPGRSVHNSDNIVLLTRAEHRCVSGYFSRSYRDGVRGYSRLRDYLAGKSWSVQYTFGLNYIERCRRELRNRRPSRR